jgi:hypothetical protein
MCTFYKPQGKLWQSQKYIRICEHLETDLIHVLRHINDAQMCCRPAVAVLTPGHGNARSPLMPFPLWSQHDACKFLRHSNLVALTKHLTYYCFEPLPAVSLGL